MCSNKMRHGNRPRDEGEGQNSMTLEVVAHRGANREAGENTLPAFERAVAMGVQGIELDIQCTRDGIPVVHHDPVLAKSQSGAAIASFSLQELRDRSEMPTLDEVIALVDGRCRLYVEIKAPKAVEAVVERLRNHLSWSAIHSFDHRVVAHAHALEPRLKCGILLVSYLIEIEAAMRAAGATDVWQQADYIDRELVDRVHAVGGRVLAWTVNDVTRGRTLANMNVDAICTDDPRQFLSAFRLA